MKPKSIKFATMTIRDASRKLLFQLYHLYDDREAANIADWVMEYITGWKKIDRIINKEVKLSQQAEKLLDECIAALCAHTPVQYVLHEAWFYGLKFYVNENVLIPRPETEELVHWMVNDVQSSSNSLPRVLDIGTGSGCIAVAIKKQLPAAAVYACDISISALEVAHKNAAAHAAAITFSEIDVLDSAR